MAVEFKITGSDLAVVNRALEQVDAQMKNGARQEITALGGLVARDAEALALARIPRVGLAWSRMRVGQTSRLVYVVPRKRGTRQRQLKRPNFAPLMKQRAMVPARDRNKPELQRRFQKLAAAVTARFNRG